MSNWPKVIQYTAITVATNVVGVCMSVEMKSFWPIVIVVLGCSSFSGYFIVRNAISEWREINRLQNW